MFFPSLFCARLTASFQQSTVMFTTHKLAYAAQADFILFLENGKLVEQGTHSELIKIEGGGYCEMWEAEAGVYNK